MGQFFCQQCGHRTMDLSMICPDCEPNKWERHKLRNKKIDELIQLYEQEREARERAERELEDAKRYLAEEQSEFRQERKVREKYENILRTLVEAQDEIDVEAEKPLHERSKVPVVKKEKAIKEARRVLGGE